jgi:hypothetical protein
MTPSAMTEITVVFITLSILLLFTGVTIIRVVDVRAEEIKVSCGVAK